MDREVIINNRKIKLSNCDKVFWPDEGFTKDDLLNYYLAVAKYILPYLKDRPESLHRFPDGISGMGFYQKNVEKHPDWVKTKKVWSESTGGEVNFVLCNDVETLVYLVNLGCIEMNVWSSRANKQSYPDYLVLDLDPEEIDFDAVIKAAQVTKEVLDLLRMPSFVKTSGATGIHIFVPMGAKYSYDQVKGLAKVIAIIVHDRLPETTSLERRPEKRQNKVYLDYLQNNQGATMASVYSVRPKPGATVSMPLEWREVKSGLRPTDFTIKNALKIIERRGDIFETVLGGGIDLKAVLARVNGLSKS